MSFNSKDTIYTIFFFSLDRSIKFKYLRGGHFLTANKNSKTLTIKQAVAKGNFFNPKKIFIS